MKNGRVSVAFVCDYSLDYLGGAQTALLEQARVLAAAGHEVIMIMPRGGKEVAAAGIRVVEVAASVTLPGLQLPVVRNTPALQSRVRAVLQDCWIDVVHLHSEFGLSAAVVDVAEELEIRVVHTVHTFFWQTGFPAQRALAVVADRFHGWLTGWPRDYPSFPLDARPGNAALRTLTWRLARRATLVISPSEHQAGHLRAAGIDRVTTVPNTLSGLPEPAEPPPCRPVRILWVGRCSPEKRLLPFVRAALRAVERVGTSRLSITVAGDGEQLTAARRIARGRAGVRFLGRCPHAEVVRMFRDHHLLAVTSYGFDNQPMSIVEAVLAGRGVLYCDPRLTEGTTSQDDQGTAGILTDGPDEAAWEERLIDLAETPEQVIAACRAAGTARDVFQPETFLTKITAAYGSAVTQKQDVRW